MFKKIDWIFFKKSLKVLVPIVLSSMVVVSISFVDGIMVNGFSRPNQPPKVDYAAVGIAGELWFAFQAFYAATMILFGIFYSQFAHNTKSFTNVAKLNFWFSMTTTIVISLVMFLAAEPLINLFFLSSPGAEANYVKPIAVGYFKILSLGHIFISLAWACLNPLTIKGKTQYALYISLVSLLLNFILDYIFIYLLQNGAQGSAWATTISYVFEFAITIFFVIKHKKWFKGFSKIFSLDKFITKEIFKRTTIFITYVLMQVSFAAATTLYTNLYTADIIKPMTVGYTVSSIMFTVFAGINRGVKVFIGPLLGQGKFKEAQIVAKKLWISNLFLSLIFILLALISATFFPQLMLNNPSDIKIAQKMILIFSGVLMAYVIVNYYSSILETSGFQLISNVWNYFYPVWSIIPAIFLFSHFGLNLSFEMNFLVSQAFYYIPAIIVYVHYRRMRWLRRI